MQIYLWSILLAGLAAFAFPASATSCLDELDPNSRTAVSDLRSCITTIYTDLSRIEKIESRLKNVESKVDEKASNDSLSHEIEQIKDIRKNIDMFEGKLSGIATKSNAISANVDNISNMVQEGPKKCRWTDWRCTSICDSEKEVVRGFKINPNSEYCGGLGNDLDTPNFQLFCCRY